MKKILIVEADDEQRSFLTDRLADPHTQVLAAADGAKAVDWARLEQPDLILLGVDLPGMNGPQVCAALRGSSSTARIPVILLATPGEATNHVHGLQCGADAYVLKPVDFGWLNFKMQALLRDPTVSAMRNETVQ